MLLCLLGKSFIKRKARVDNVDIFITSSSSSLTNQSSLDKWRKDLTTTTSTLRRWAFSFSFLNSIYLHEVCVCADASFVQKERAGGRRQTLLSSQWFSFVVLPFPISRTVLSLRQDIGGNIFLSLLRLDDAGMVDFLLLLLSSRLFSLLTSHPTRRRRRRREKRSLGRVKNKFTAKWWVSLERCVRVR